MRRKKVLLVDDERHLLDTLEYILKSADFDVDITEDGENALEILGGNCDYDVMVTGLRKSAMDNTELLRKLRLLKKLLPVIIISSRSKKECCPEQDSEAIHLEKPFDADELIRSIKQAIKEFKKDIR